jgi:hypothetical protein
MPKKPRGYVAATLIILGCERQPTEEPTRPAEPQFTEVFAWPDVIRLPVGQQSRVYANGLTPTRERKDLSTDVTWEVDAPFFADVTEGPEGQGTLTGYEFGSTLLRARLGEVVSEDVPVEVTSTQVRALDLSPNGVFTHLRRGDSLPLQATAVFRDGRSSNANGQVQWTSSDEAIATVAPDGRVTALDFGDAFISAQLGTLVSAPSLVSVVQDRPNLRIKALRRISDGVQVVVENDNLPNASDFWVDLYTDRGALNRGDPGDAYAYVRSPASFGATYVNIALADVPQQLFAYVDTNGDVVESDEADNSFEGTLALPIGEVNIGIRDYRALTDEDNIYLFFELMNYGDTATGPFDVRVTEGDDASLSEPFTLHMVSMPGLGPYGEVTGQLMFNPSCRSCSLQVEVDPDGLLDDTDRSDNVSAQFYTRLKDPT